MISLHSHARVWDKLLVLNWRCKHAGRFAAACTCAWACGNLGVAGAKKTATNRLHKLRLTRRLASLYLISIPLKPYPSSYPRPIPSMFSLPSSPIKHEGLATNVGRPKLLCWLVSFGGGCRDGNLAKVRYVVKRCWFASRSRNEIACNQNLRDRLYAPAECKISKGPGLPILSVVLRTLGLPASHFRACPYQCKISTVESIARIAGVWFGFRWKASAYSPLNQELYSFLTSLV
jgi:hypothetical protein